MIKRTEIFYSRYLVSLSVLLFMLCVFVLVIILFLFSLFSIFPQGAAELYSSPEFINDIFFYFN